MAKKYWAYVNDDKAEDIVSDLGEFDTLVNAVFEVGIAITADFDNETTDLTYRVVDNDTSTTVWIAGPGNTIVQPEGWSVMDENH